MTSKKYTWTAPKAFVEDMVNFLDHRGAVRCGKVAHIATHYGHTSHTAYHIYSVYVEGRKRNVNVGDKNIINVVK